MRRISKHATLAAHLLTIVVGCSSEPSTHPPDGGTTSTTSAGGAGTGGSGGAACDPAQCAPPDEPECRKVGCDQGQCAYTDAPAGTPLSKQTAGDCQELVCDGKGAATSIDDDADIPAGGEECLVDGCLEGAPHPTPEADGTLCSKGICKAGTCVPTTCADGVKDQGEADVDCGGPCPGCAAGAVCTAPADCESGVCTGGTCQAPTCNDDVQNGTETALDCGGSCEPCANGLGCKAATDCLSGVCTGGVCQASMCSDAVKNGTETGIDCGGSCSPCSAGKGCLVPADCLSMVCSGGVCQAATCHDQLQNGAETGVDCGGSCAGCADGGPCAQGTDCQSGVCKTAVCQAPTCSDGVKNGPETGVDCGGPCGPCGLGQGCATNADCANQTCFAGRCAYPRFALDAPVVHDGKQQPFGVALGDFDGDGKLDAVIADADGVDVFLNHGDGTFVAPAYHPTSVQAAVVIAADVDQNGTLDLVVLGKGGLNAASSTVSVLLNQGGASFTKTDYNYSGVVQSVAVGDLDGDGKPDLAVSTSLAVHVLHNQGGGAFTDGTSLGGGAEAVAIADIDADGKLDIVAMPGTFVPQVGFRVYANQGAGAFAAPADYSPGAGFAALAVGDVDGDGRPDVILSRLTDLVVMKNEAGHFPAFSAVKVASTDIRAIALADMNADGKPDLVLATYESSYSLDPGIEIALNQGNGAFQGTGVHSTGAPTALAVGDLDGDCKPDLVATTLASGMNVLFGDGTGFFPDTPRYPGFDSVVLADLDGDGRLDITTARAYGGSEVSLRIGWGNGGPFDNPTTYSLPTNNAKDIIAADLNGDGRLDLIVAQDLSNRVAVLSNEGNRTFAAPVFHSTLQTKPSSLAAADVNGDGKVDVVVLDWADTRDQAHFQVMLNDGSGALVDGYFDVQPFSNAVALGDLDGDGKPDLAISDAGGVVVRFNDGSGVFAAGAYYPTGLGVSTLALVDLDGDGARDIAALNFQEDTVSVLRNLGDGTFAAPVDYPVSSTPVRLSVGDLDGDGRPDLAIACRDHDVITVLRNGGGVFSERTDFALWFTPTATAIGDVDGDGKADMAASTEGLMSVLTNLSGKAIIPCPTCGDGVIAPPEVCDDGGLVSGDGCSATCQLELGYACSGAPSTCAPICGDGVVAGAETCDDGNGAAGDGCDATCRVEKGWACAGAPSACATICGDGIVAGNELCDDANTLDGDGCPSTCRRELWTRTYGDAGTQQGTSVAADASGNAVIAGTFDGTLDFGGGPLASAGSNDVFVAKLSAAGDHLWSKRFGDAGDQRAEGVAVDGAGNVVVTGYFTGSPSFGGSALASAGSFDVFVTKLDDAGNHLWSKRFGDAAQQQANAVAVDKGGNVVLGGAFQGSIDFGGGALASAGSSDVFVAKLDDAGNHLWSKRFGNGATQSAAAVAVDAAGDVFITGYFSGSIDFGGGALTAVGTTDTFLAKLDASGNHVWSKRFGFGNQLQNGTAVAVDAAGDVVVTGGFQGFTDLGTGVLSSAGAYDVFVAKFSPAGSPLFARRFGSSDNDFGAAIATDAAGNVLLSGYSEGAIDFGNGPLPLTGGHGAFVAKLDPTGATVWSGGYGLDADGRGLAADAMNRVYAVGSFTGGIDFGGGARQNSGGDDVFVVKLAP